MLIVPDVHGREFWKKTLEDNPEEEVIFLGDYLDPYPEEGISEEKSIEVFKDILSLPKDRVTLLLGNHDLGYLDLRHKENICRHIWWKDSDINRLFLENLEKFGLGVFRDGVLFSHAGIHPKWVEEHSDFGGTSEEVLGYLEEHLWTSEVMEALCEFSRYRGGWERKIGSPVWSDVREWFDFPPSQGPLQVFGHTQLWEGKIIDTPEFKCIDCKRVCRITDNNKIEIL